MFLISGEIPRVTSYENGIKGGIRFEEEEEGGEGKWVKAEEILDERFLVVNLKGTCFCLLFLATSCPGFSETLRIGCWTG